MTNIPASLFSSSDVASVTRIFSKISLLQLVVLDLKTDIY